MLTLLVCPNCGGPLPPIAASSPFVLCKFCGSTSSVADKVITERHDGDALSAPEDERERAARQAVIDPEHRLRVWKSFIAALAEEAGGEPIPYATLRDAARRHLGFFGDGHVLARVTYKLALDFEQESGVPARTAECLGRFGQGYVEAIDTLRKSPSATLKLPFLATGPGGPLHYERALSASLIASLAESDPEAPAQPKRGFFARLFG